MSSTSRTPTAPRFRWRAPWRSKQVGAPAAGVLQFEPVEPRILLSADLNPLASSALNGSLSSFVMPPATSAAVDLAGAPDLGSLDSVAPPVPRAPPVSLPPALTPALSIEIGGVGLIGGAYSVPGPAIDTLDLDGSGPRALELLPLGPVSGLAEGARSTGTLSVGALDRFTFGAVAGEAVSFQIAPATGLSVTVSVFDADGVQVAQQIGAAPDAPVLLATGPLAGGAYTLDVQAQTGTAGTYTIDAAVNALLVSGDAGTAPGQDIAASAIPLGAGADRLAVTGRVGTGGRNVYRFEASAGQRLSVSLGGADAGLTLDLHDAGGALLSRGVPGGGARASVSGLVLGADQTVFATVTGTVGASHTLIATRGAALDIDGAGAAGQRVFGTSKVLGRLGGTTAGSFEGVTRVAVLNGSGSGAQLAARINGSALQAFTATAVSYNAVTLASLEEFDVVVLGDYGESSGSLDSIQSTLRTWVEAGHGAVATGYTIYQAGTYTGTVLPDIDAFVPVYTSGSALFQGPGLVDILSEVHPVTDGVSDFTFGGYGESGPADAGATVLATFEDGNPAVVVGEAGLGRGVYIGASLAGGYANQLGSYTSEGQQLLEQALAWAAQGRDVADRFQQAAVAGTTLTFATTTPPNPDGTQGTLDPLLVLLNPAGVEVARNDNGAADGRNASLSYTATETGTYIVEVRAVGDTSGAYVLDMSGAATQAFTATVVSPAPSARLNQFPDTVLVTLSSPALLTSVQPGALTVNGVAAISVLVIDQTTLQFTLATAGAADGDYVIELADGALTRLDGEGLTGTSSAFNLDATQPAVIASTVPFGSAVLPGNVTITLTLSEPLNPATIPAAITLFDRDSGAFVQSATLSYSAGLLTLGAGFTGLDEGNYALYLGGDTGSLLDFSGNPLAPYAFEFSVDLETKALPAFEPVAPAGSLVAGSTLVALANFDGDVDVFTVAIGADQSLAVALTPSPGWGATLEVLNSLGSVIRTSAAVGLGQTVLLEVAAGLGASSVRVTASRPGGELGATTVSLGQSGAYTLTAAVNATVGAGIDSGLVGSAGDAQAIDGSSISLGGGADRLAVTGLLGAAGRSIYAFGVRAGQSVTLALGSDSGQGVSFGVYDASGALLATGAPGTSDIRSLVAGLGNAQDATLYVLVEGEAAAQHTLVVTRGAAFGLELEGPQELFGADAALGYLGATGGSGDGTVTRVAVLNAGRAGGLVTRLNTSPSGRIIATSVTALQIDTLAELAAYDVVVLGDEQFGPPSAGLDAISPTLRTWVEAGNGVLATGFTVYAAGSSTGTPIAAIDAIVPVNTSGSYNVLQNFPVTITATHPITQGIANFTFNSYGEYASIDAGATVLATSGSVPILVIGTPGTGRSVYLSPSIADGYESGLGALDSPGQRLLEQALVWAGNTRDVVDRYQVPAVSGATLTFQTTTPSDPDGTPGGLDPLLVLFGPNGVEVARNDNGGIDGRNAVLSHVATGNGIYVLEVRNAGEVGGAYVLQLAGAAASAPFTASIVTPAPGAQLRAFPSTVRVTLSSPALLSTVQASDLTVNGVAASAVTVIDSSTLQFSIANAASGDGDYTVSIANGALTRLDGAALQAATSLFNLDATPPAVASSTLAFPSVVQPGALSFTLTLTEALDPSGLDATDAILTNVTTGRAVPAASFAYNPTALTLALSFAGLDEGSYTLAFNGGPAGLRDLRQNGFATVLDFSVDTAEQALPAFVALAPFGGLVQRSTVAGQAFATGDVDSFTLALDDDQALSVTLAPAGTLAARVELLDSIGGVVATGTGAGAGSPVLVQVPPAAGVRAIRVTSLGGAGAYTLTANLNAGTEQESAAGQNDTAATAESLAPSVVSLAAGADRLAVQGRIQGAADVDDYSFTLAAGQVATLAVGRTSSSSLLSLSLTDDAGVELARGFGGSAIGVDGAVYRFVAGASGTYHARIGSAGAGASTVAYTLVVTRGADFDIEVPDSETLETGGIVLGGLDRGGSAVAGAGGANGSVPLPTVLFDGTGYRWDPQQDGNINDGVNDAYDGGLRLAGFSSFGSAATELSGRQLVIGPQTIGGVQVTRKVYIPSTPGEGFARFLEVVSNTSSATQTFSVRVDTNLGSDGSTITYATSSGDLAFTTDDNWIGTDDFNGGGDPTLLHVVAGANARQRPAAASLSGDGLSFRYDLTLAPGQTQIVMHFASQSVNQATALAQAPRLASLDGASSALAGLTAAERSQIVNFNAGDTLDRYVVAVQAGDTLNVSLTRPGSGPDAPSNTLAPALRLFNANGVLVASAVGDALSYPVPNQSGGRYELQVLRSDPSGLASGEYVLRIEGATGPAAGTAPRVLSSSVPTDGGSVAALPGFITLTFSEGLRLDTLAATDLVLSGGASAVGVTVLDGRTARFAVTGPAGAGVFQYSLVAGAVTDLQGTGNEAFAGSFNVDRAGPVVVSQSPSIQAAAPFTSIAFTFDEAIDPASVSVADLTVFTGPTGANLRGQVFSAVVSGRTVTFTFNAQNAQGEYGFSVGPGITDLVGNAMAAPVSGTLALTSPDLRVTSVTAPAALVFGSPATVSWTVSNVGTDPALGRWTDRVFLSRTPNLNGSPYYLGDFAGNAATLAVGGSYTRSATVTPPLVSGAVDGTWYVVVQTDIYGQQAESSEANNVAASTSVPVTVPPLPDLSVSAIVAPAEVLSGQVIPITWTVTNTGAANTGAFSDAIFLADSPQGANLQYFGAFQLDDGLAAGQSVTRTQTITLPAVYSGTKYVQIRSDYFSQVFENQNEANNIVTSASPMLVRLQTFPNLVVTAVTPPVQAFSGQSTSVSWTVGNTGTGPTSSPAWYDQVYLSLDRTFDAADVLVATVVNPAYLDVGQNYASSASFVLPQGISGTYYLLISTDAYGQVNEYPNEGDNRTASAAIPVQLTPPPNLVVASVTAPANAFSGQPLTLNWRVNNTGTGRTAGAAWSDRIVLSADATLDASDTVLNQGMPHFGELAPGEGYTASATVNLPIGVQGDFHFFVLTDTYNQLFEHVFETDNTGRTTTPTRVSLTPPPDLETEITAAPIAGSAGRTVSLTYSVTNFGSTPTPNTNWLDRIYLSATPTLDGSARVLADASHYGVLDVDQSYEVTRTLTLPLDLVGTFYFIVKADVNLSVFQLDRANDIAVSSPAQVVLALSDLVVTATTATATAENGGQLQVDWTIGNTGAGDTIATSWVDRIYATSAGTRDDAVLLGSFGRTGLLAPGESYSETRFVTVPFTFAGPYTVYVRTDAGGRVPESNEANNASGPGATVTVRSRLADLTVANLAVPPAGQAGELVEVSFTVNNTGLNRTDATYWYDNVYVSGDDALDGGDVLIASIRRSNALDAGASYDVVGNVRLPETLAAGSYRLIVSADGSNQALEGSEGNNLATSAAIAVAARVGAPNGDGGIGSTAFPSLAVTSVDAPDAAISGQPITIGWTVSNGGDAANRVWYDGVYLSRDQVLDRTQDIYLGATAQSSVAAGGSYAATLTATLPQGLSGPFWVFVTADSTRRLNDTSRTDNTRYDPNAVTLSLAPPVDLVAGSITVPPEALLGVPVGITYTVANNSARAAVGTWVDSLYLSTDGVWTVDDPLIGRVTHFGGVAANGSYTETLSAALPGVALGTYKVIVRSDILNAVPESNEANNLSASLDRVEVDVPALTLGTATAGTLFGGKTYFRVSVAADEALRFTLNVPDGLTSNQIFVRQGGVPTTATFDATSTDPFGNAISVTVPSTAAGTYYILIDSSLGSTAYTLLAEIVPFGVASVSTGAASDAGSVTLRIEGARFAADTVFELVSARGQAVASYEVALDTASLAFATFDMRSAPGGSYTLRATRANGDQAVRAAALTITPDGVGAAIKVNISGPQQVRPERLNVFQVNYANIGGADTRAPLLLLTTASNSDMGLTIDTIRAGTLHILGADVEGPLDIYRPGAQSSVSVLFRSGTAQQGVRINARAVTSDNIELITDWSAIEGAVRPDGIANDAWTGFWTRIQPRIGTTWGDYVGFLNDVAVMFSPPGQPVRDIRALFNELFTRMPDYLPSVSFSGRLTVGTTGVGLAGIDVAVYRQEGASLALAGIATSGANGAFSFSRLKPGMYQLAVADNSVTPVPGTLGFDVNRDGIADDVSPLVNLVQDVDTTGIRVDVVRVAPVVPVALEVSPVLERDAAGRLHVVWMRDGTLWHSVNDGGGWTQGRQIAGSEGARDVRLVIDPALLGAAGEGLLVSWTAGNGNASEIYQVVGKRNTLGGYQWTPVIRVTNDAVSDEAAAVGVGADGTPVYLWPKQDSGIADDTDLYTRTTVITDPTFVSELEAAFDLISDKLAAMSDAQLETLGIHRIRFNYTVGKITVPASIPGIGGTYEAEVRGDFSGQIGATLALGGSIAGKVKVGTKGEVEIRGSGQARWKANKDTCEYEFDSARFSITAAGAINLPIDFLTAPLLLAGVPTFAINPFLSALGFESRLEVAVGGEFIWNAGSDFPSWPSRVEGNIGVGFGLNFEKELSAGWFGFTKITGRLIGTVKIKLTSAGFDFGSPPFQVSALIRGEVKTPVRKWSIDYTGTWPGINETFSTEGLYSVGPPVLGMGLDPSLTVAPSDLVDDPSDQRLTISVSDLDLGTLADYGGSGIAAVTADRTYQGSPDIAEAPDGTLHAVWDEAGGVVASRYDPATGRWSAAVAVDTRPDSVRDLQLAFDGLGTGVAVWNRLDVSGLDNSATTDDVLAVVQSGGDLVFATRDAATGLWSAPQDLRVSAGLEDRVALGRGADGNIIAAWVATPTATSTDSRVEAVVWNASTRSWSSVRVLATGVIAGTLAVSSLGSAPVVVWSEKPDGVPAVPRLYSATFDGTDWSAPELFTFVAADVLGGLTMAVAAADSGQAYSTGVPLPAVPHEICDDEDDDEEDEDEDEDQDDDEDEDQDDDQDDYNPPVIVPRDPNDIIGPSGFGPEGFIPAAGTYTYRIRFENAADAAAPAQSLVITQQLDADLDWRTFRVDDFGFDNQVFQLEGNRAFYSARLDLVASKGFLVDVSMAIDVSTGLATWTLAAIDPATGEHPADATVGLLPPNDATGRGDGFVSYTVRAKRTAPTGTVVGAQARIVFDTEAPIDTPPIFNTLDAVAPSSQIENLPATSDTPDFLVSWSGTDDEAGSAVGGYTVSVSRDGEAAEVWLLRTDRTSGTYSGTAGSTYRFYVTAYDNARNEEAASTTPDGLIVVGGGVTGSISGSVFDDTDGSGTRNAGEPGLAGFTVLLDTNGNGMADVGETTAITGGTGGYTFGGLATGDYIVTVLVAAGTVATTPTTRTATVVAGETASGGGVGVFTLGSIAGLVFSDIDGDGAQASGEPGLSGRTVFLDADNDGTLDAGEATATTTDAGVFLFTGVGPGVNHVRAPVPSGWRASTVTLSDVSLTSGQAVTALAFGTQQLGSIAGTKFEDLNGNSVRDAGEAGLAGWTIFLDANGNTLLDVGERSTVSGEGGAYLFADVTPGAYVVSEVLQPGWRQTYPGPGRSNVLTLTTSASSVALAVPESGASAGPSGLVSNPAGNDAAWAAALTGLDRFRADPRFAGLDGSGLTVAVIDTGIDLNHSYFGPDSDRNGTADRIVYAYDFADGDSDASDRAGHGSNVASVIASSNALNRGVAPGAGIAALKVFSDAGTGYFLYVERALQWVVANADTYNIAVVNLSLGDSGNYASAASRYGLGDELAALAAQGVIVVAAGGNSFYTFDSKPGVSYPASDPEVIGVGAVWSGDYGGAWTFSNGASDLSTGADRIAGFSQRSTALTDVVAPGARLTGANATGGTSAMQGTSQAAAYVSGVATLAQSVAFHELGRPLTPTEFARLLAASADLVTDGDDENDNVRNTGAQFPRVNVEQLAVAITALRGTTPDGGGGGIGPTTPGTPPPARPLDGHATTVVAGAALQGVDFGNFRLAALTGLVFEDLNSDGLRGSGEAVLSGRTVFLDADDDGVLDSGEQSVTSGSDGSYGFVDLEAGSVVVRTVAPAGWVSTGAFRTVITSGAAPVGNLGSHNLPPLVLNERFEVAAAGVLVVPAAGVLANDTDPSGDPLTVTLTDGPAHGTLVLAADGGFTYRPIAGYSGRDSFGYAVGDGHGNVVNGTASITVGPVPNTAPALDAVAAQRVNEGSLLSFSVRALDAEGDGIAYSLVTAPQGATLDAATGLFGWRPADGPFAFDVTIRATDARDPALFTERTFTVTVDDVAPVAVLQGNGTVVQGTAYTVSFSVTDPGADTVSQYFIDWGDGTLQGVTRSGGVLPASVSHVYDRSGTYAVKVAALNEDGLFDGTGLSVAVARPVLAVTSLVQTASGLAVRFNDSFDQNAINLYGAAGSGAADLTLVGAATGAVRGSVVFDADGRGLVFVKTGGILAADSYTVALASGANGFGNAAGALDGDGDGVAGGAYAASFAVAAAPGTVSVSDIMRGPGQEVNFGRGLPITLNGAAGVTRLVFHIDYDPALLTITGLTPGANAAGTTAELSVSGGRATVTILAPTGLGGGRLTVANLLAQVPSTASYGARHVLDVTIVEAVGGTLVADDAIAVVGFVGDTDGSRSYSAADASLVQRVITRADSGFGAWSTVDPTLVADVDGNGVLTSIDAARISQVAAGQTRPEIPALPAPVPLAQTTSAPMVFVDEEASMEIKLARRFLDFRLGAPAGTAAWQRDFVSRAGGGDASLRIRL